MSLALALFSATFLLAAAAAAPAQPRETSHPSSKGLPSNVERVDSLAGITQYRLRSNGMNIYLSPNHAAPVVTFLVVYHVGSRNEAPGNTGSAHLLEHMLFNKSTKNFGKANKKQTFQEVLYAAGADYASTNMTTWNDRMTGYSTLPADKLDIDFDANTATVTVSGTVPDQETREKVVVCCGNVASVEHVNDQLKVANSGKPGEYYTVKSGDTLSKIAKHYYGDANRYSAIFEANKPMLSDPDKIYPGQTLRIPQLS